MIISDLKYHIVFIVALDPPMTGEMEKALRKIFREEADALNVSLAGLRIRKNYHMASVIAPPEITPARVAASLREGVSRRVTAAFAQKLSGWGSIYGEPVMIKSGAAIPEARVEDFLRLSLGGF